MIVGNIIKFGYGDVLIGSNQWTGSMNFTNIKPPLTPGLTVSQELYDTLELGLELTIIEDSSWDLYDLLKTVDEDNRIVKYKDYTFDFSHYNQNSVNSAVKLAFKTVCLMALAC